MELRHLELLLLAVCPLLLSSAFGSQTSQGSWKLLKKSIGISAMHMALLPNDRIVAFDRTDFGPSNLTFAEGKCHYSQSPDCYVHSIEFNSVDRSLRPLTIVTDTWCSSGALLPNGVLLQTGGDRLGERVARYLKPCLNCDWMEVPNALLSPRWYASNQILPDGKVIVVGGRYQFSYEFVPKSSMDQKVYQLPFLKETRYSGEIPNNLYPFLHLSTDGNLFIFANNKAILLDYLHNKVLRRYPKMPGSISRNYPSTGSSVLLPIKLSRNSSTQAAEVIICGGTLPDSNAKANAGEFLPASKSCGRLKVTATMPHWEMEEMPLKRVMGDMILLPTGDVLIINGAAKGTAGWGVAREPVLSPVLYHPDSKRFETLSPSRIPRLYHSTAHLLSDGRVLVGGSNPNSNYNFTAIYPTELSLEAFSPPYLSPSISRPSISEIKPATKLNYDQKFSVTFQLKNRKEILRGNLKVTMVAPSFTTHSFSMNQRLLVLPMDHVAEASPGNYVAQVFAPATATVAPPGYYLVFVVNEDVPSKGRWVQIK